ncbi:MAG: protein kinase [Gammaproteobacteria bacterium]|nr:protein kinase [Gammaproteobacteria bacterium]
MVPGDQALIEFNIETFFQKLNTKIDRLNTSIDDFNRLTSDKEKALQLQLIKAQFKNIQDGALDGYVSLSPDYHQQLNEQLYQEIQAEEKLLQQSSAAPAAAETLAGIDKPGMSKAVQLLETGSGSFSLGRGWSSRALGGSNSKNMLLTKMEKNTKTGADVVTEQCVLKLENRMNLASGAESYLRTHGLSGVLTEDWSKRQVNYRGRVRSHNMKFVEKDITRNVLLTEYCEGGDLESQALKSKTPRELLHFVIDTGKQQAEILGIMGANGCIHTDMKNSNFLVDADGNVRVADTKGFAFTDKEKQCSTAYNASRNGAVVTSFASTKHMIPPEGFERQSADKIHVYLLGKDLYQAATGCPSQFFYMEEDPQALKPIDQFNFNLPIFEDGEGVNLRNLIQSSMVLDPSERPSMDTVITHLGKIGQSLPAPLPLRDTAIAYEGVKACTANPVKLPEGSLPLITDDVHHTDGSDKLVIYSDVVKQLKQIKKRSSDDVKNTDIDVMMCHLAQTIEQANTPEELQATREVLDVLVDELKQDWVDVPGRERNRYSQEKVRVKIYEGEELKAAESNKALRLIDKISAHQITLGGVEDIVMTDFIMEAGRRAINFTDIEDIKQLSEALDSTYEVLEAGKKYVQFAEEALNEKSKFKWGIGEKKRAVGEAIIQIPLEKRGDGLKVTMKDALNAHQRFSSKVSWHSDTGTARVFQEKVERDTRAQSSGAETTHAFKAHVGDVRAQGEQRAAEEAAPKIQEGHTRKPKSGPGPGNT